MSSPDPDEVEHIPPEAASTYTKLAAEYGQTYYQSVADDLAGRLTPGSRLLDAGTGPGFLPLLVADRVDDVRIDAFDFTAELVSHGRRQTRQRGVEDCVSFFVGDCYGIPVVSERYSLLTCTGVLHSLDHPVRALTEFYRVLQPGGEAWVFDPAILDVPDDLDIHLTEHEQEVFESYGTRAAEETPPLSVREAERLAARSPFETVDIEEGKQGDVRLYLHRNEYTGND